jgi:magnesium transporter
MQWHDIADPADPELDRLAERYNLHPLHVEDCRHRGQRAKVETGDGYIFMVIKALALRGEDSLDSSDLDIFLGADWLITVQETANRQVREIIEHVQAGCRNCRPDQVAYRLADLIVDAYAPLLDQFDDRIDVLEDEVLHNPRPHSLAAIFSLKRCLVDVRRVMANMRDVANHLQRAESDLVRPDTQPFFRDVYDHLARSLDLLEGQRDLLAGAMDIYLSSVANRTNQVMKVLTVVGTITLPVLLVSSIYGMNIEGLPWAHANQALYRVLAVMFVLTGALLGYLKLRRWL